MIVTLIHVGMRYGLRFRTILVLRACLCYVRLGVSNQDTSVTGKNKVGIPLYSSEPYGETWARCCRAVNRLVHIDRLTYPISDISLMITRPRLQKAILRGKAKACSTRYLTMRLRRICFRWLPGVRVAGVVLVDKAFEFGAKAFFDFLMPVGSLQFVFVSSEIALWSMSALFRIYASCIPGLRRKNKYVGKKSYI